MVVSEYLDSLYMSIDFGSETGKTYITQGKREIGLMKVSN